MVEVVKKDLELQSLSVVVKPGALRIEMFDHRIGQVCKSRPNDLDHVCNPCSRSGLRIEEG